MGLYDEITCHYPLPGIEQTEMIFQTKSFANTLCQFEIRDDGTLWQKHRDDPSNWAERYYTGEIQFYTSLDQKDFESGWVEF